MSDIVADTGEATLQEQVEARDASQSNKFGTFAGVFTPTLLTILGVIMFLREGWVVGNAGLLGAWAIIGVAVGITTLTGLSMSSMTTNIRIGAGGAFSIISQSLGLEIGGAIGIPLYLSQTLAVAMYIFGFRDGWMTIFPNHIPLVVDLVTFAALFAIAMVSAGLAFRIQFVIMAVLVLALGSVFATVFTGAMQYQPTLIGSFPGSPENGFSGTSFWVVFAVFFPAATGIMAGANMSGELKNPRRSIPIGTMSAIALSSVIYVALAYWLARVATPEQLVSNYAIMIEKALIPALVLAGLLGATFSSGLSSLVGSPRVLQALALHDILPGSRQLAKQTTKGEPRTAMIVSGVIVVLALFLRNLNAIAPLITMFFLIAYGMINLVVFIEQSLGLVSFRPLLRIPRVLPLIGALGCVFAMFVIAPAFSLAAVALVVAFYIILLRRHLRAPFGDVRSGLFVALAEWAAKRVNDLPIAQERAWKPNVMVPVEDPADLRGTFQLIFDLAYPRGSLHVVGISRPGEEGRLQTRLPNLERAFREKDLYAKHTIIVGDDYGQGLLTSMQALSGVFFRPNAMFLAMPAEGDIEREAALSKAIAMARSRRLGVQLFADHPKARLGRRQAINVWVRDQGPDWQLSMHLGNLDLALLTAYMLRRNWTGEITLVTVVPDQQQADKAEVYLKNLAELARLPHAQVAIKQGSFNEVIVEEHPADLNIFGMPDQVDFEMMRNLVINTRSAALFVRDSGEENAMA
ncbi:MAG: Na-K-Cl cotransporter [Anaerolineae bacterium]|nr:Na-K-Cl cotransporter [Anaerolineae bacterium]MCB0200424.1 Na-K-Cl cotransporter [Anaerolineae bacterium]MCB0204511.1 Na-K-Cl cotransporter [Anaerolineae bacterium]